MPLLGRSRTSHRAWLLLRWGRRVGAPRARLPGLPNWNLDIGVVEDPSDPYPLTVRTERDLEARRRA